MPLAASVGATVLALPKFSLPSVTITTRLAVSSGNEAAANFSAFQIGRIPPLERRFERARVGDIIVVRRHFDGRIPSEDDDPRSVVPLAVAMRPHIAARHTLASVPVSRRNALRLVEHIDHRDLFAHPFQLHLRQGRDDDQ